VGPFHPRHGYVPHRSSFALIFQYKLFIRSYAHPCWLVPSPALLPPAIPNAFLEHVDVQDDHYKLVREMGAASVVLLKNVNGTLPSKKPKSLFTAGGDT